MILDLRSEGTLEGNRSFFLSRRNFFAAGTALFLSLAVTAACSPRTDFDRPTMSTTNPNVIRNPGSYSGADEVEGLLSDFKLTQREKVMRNLGYRLLVPLGPEPALAAFAGARRYANRRYEPRPLSSGPAYYRWLKDGYERTGFSMWARLIDDIEADEISALRFTPAMQRVLQTDFDRHQIFLARGELDVEELRNLTARLTENRRYGDMVAASLEDRIAAYEYAAKRARVEVPSEQYYTVTQTLIELAERSAEMAGVLDQDYSSVASPMAMGTAPLAVIEAPIIDQTL